VTGLQFFLGSENEGLGRMCVCEILLETRGKLLLKGGKFFNKPSEMNVRAERSVLSGKVDSKQEERRLMKIPEVDNLTR
jgi:hypothetical protein